MDSIKTEIVVVGAGPGGYAAAFYAADLGKKVILIEKEKKLGGVCLNRGCIPSKALLYATHQIVNSRESAHRGITFAEPKVDVAKLREWKDSIIVKLSGGVATLAKMRGVEVIAGRGYFEGSNKLRVETEQGQKFIEYEQAILAVGSIPAMPKAFDLGNPRVMTSTEALEIEDIPENGTRHGLRRARQQNCFGRGVGKYFGRSGSGFGASRRGERKKNVQGNPP
jgi:dihydrolipoamide dehydrogenase